MRDLGISAMALTVGDMLDRFAVKSFEQRTIGAKKVKHGRTYRCNHLNDPGVFAREPGETHAERMDRKKAQRTERRAAYLRAV